MVHQATKLNGDGRVGPIRGVTQGASSVVCDALDLLELHTQLLRADSANCLKQAKPSATGLVISLGMLVSSLPVLGLGLASFLAWLSQWPEWICQLFVGGVFLAIACSLAWYSVRQLRRSLNAFETTQREAANNIHWLRQTLSRSLG